MKNLLGIKGWLVMAAALTAGMASCSGDDIADDVLPATPATPAQHTYTMTIEATKNNYYCPLNFEM